MNNHRVAVLFALLLSLGASRAQAEKYVIYNDSEHPMSAELKSFLQDDSKILSLDLTAEEAQEYVREGLVIEPKVEFEITGWVEERPSIQANWAEGAMDVAKAHQLSDSKGAGKSVCVIDTGVDRDHSLLKGKIAPLLSTMPNGKATDGHGHGTHVASLVVGATSLGSSATAARVISVKALGDDGLGDSDWISRAVEKCVKQGADIISMSLSSKNSSEVLRLAIRDAINSGVIVVAGSGNNSGPIRYPAAYSGVISVGASTNSGGIASFSNYGSSLKFVAPGQSILGARKGGGTIVMSGTSMATPFVAGMMALKLTRQAKGLVAKKLQVSSVKQGAGQVDAYKTATNK